MLYRSINAIYAQPMPLGRAQAHGFKCLGDHENPLTEGYVVEFIALGPGVWVEKMDFERAYKPPPKPFGDALEALKRGSKVQRTDWQPNDVWLELRPINEGVALALVIVYGCNGDTPSNHTQPWSPTTLDMLTDDWVIIP